jgi:hypothetical protein
VTAPAGPGTQAKITPQHEAGASEQHQFRNQDPGEPGKQDAARSDFMTQLQLLNHEASNLDPSQTRDYGKLSRLMQELRMCLAGQQSAPPKTPTQPLFYGVQPMKISPNQHVKRQLPFTSTRPPKRMKEHRKKPEFHDFNQISQDLSKKCASTC